MKGIKQSKIEMSNQWNRLRYGRKLTETQLNALQIIHDQESVPEDTSEIHGNTLNSLRNRKYIHHILSASGWEYIVSNKGLEYLDIVHDRVTLPIPKGITLEILDQMIPVWQELKEKGWNQGTPYMGLCEHFEEFGVEDAELFLFLEKNFKRYMGFVFFQPDTGKKGAAVRLHILQEIRTELLKKK